MRLSRPIVVYLPLHGRQKIQLRGLGSTGAERGVVCGTGPVMEAEPAEFVLTAGIAALHVRAPPARRVGTKQRGHGRAIISVLLSRPRHCVSGFVNNQQVPTHEARHCDLGAADPLMALGTEEIHKIIPELPQFSSTQGWP